MSTRQQYILRSVSGLRTSIDAVSLNGRRDRQGVGNIVVGDNADVCFLCGVTPQVSIENLRHLLAVESVRRADGEQGAQILNTYLGGDAGEETYVWLL